MRRPYLNAGFRSRKPQVPLTLRISWTMPRTLEIASVWSKFAASHPLDRSHPLDSGGAWERERSADVRWAEA